MQPYNGHVYSENSTVKLGDITDRDGNLLATTEDGSRLYSSDETVRRALLHTVGDPYGYISTSVQYTMRAQLPGYNMVTGLNDTIFNRMGSDIALTIDQDACVAAYNALGGKNGGVIVYNYETGEILVKVSTPTFDPNAVPEDLETNEAYKGVYLDNTLSGSFTPGSIFKIVTAAAAMERYPDSWSSITYDCQGSCEMAGSDITCLNGHAHGTQDMAAALGNSCNVYFAQLANDLGAEALQQKAEEMGFNTQLDFGSIPIAESTIDLTGTNANQLGWAGVGQYTVLTNPYHMMVLMGAIANGGTYVEPGSPRIPTCWGAFQRRPQLVSSTEAQNLKTLLRNNVEYYYGDWLFPDGVERLRQNRHRRGGGGQRPQLLDGGLLRLRRLPPTPSPWWWRTAPAALRRPAAWPAPL